MPVANCSKCNRVFQRAESPICPACYQASRSQLQMVSQFIVDHPQRTLEQIAEGVKLPLKELEEMLYSGKLGLVASKIIYHCQGCHKSIPATARHGHFCSDCAEKIETSAGLQGAMLPEPPQRSSLKYVKPASVADSETSGFPLTKLEPVKSEGSYGFKRLTSSGD